MKHLLLLLVFALPYFSMGQDTLSRANRYKGIKTLLISMDGDTSFHSYYPDGTIESIRPYTLTDSTTTYQRFYPSGNLLWTREMKNGKANGATTFYNRKGKKMASLEFKNDTLIDTNFMSSKEHFIFGHATYYSVVHGGMPREDGRSNISGGPGTFMHTKLNAVKLDSTKSEQEVYQELYTDFNGFYMIQVEKGSFGIYPSHYDVKTIDPRPNAIQVKHTMSGEYSWNGGPIEIADQTMNFLNLHSHSVGYAP